jgi:hypothetical protein
MLFGSDGFEGFEAGHAIFAEFEEDKNEQQQRQLISRFAFGFAPAFGRAVGPAAWPFVACLKACPSIPLLLTAQAAPLSTRRANSRFLLCAALRLE